MSKTYLVTGGAGFIGSNFIHYLLEKHDDILIVNVDKLTYAGNLENLKAVMADKRHVFVQADICDGDAMQKLFEQYTVDYVVNFAAESHVDRSITDPDVFVRTNVMGTLKPAESCQACMEDGRGQLQGWGEVPAGLHRRGVRIAGTGGVLHRDHPPGPPQPVLGKQGLGRPVGEGVFRHLQASCNHHPLLEQLRSLPVSREAHPTDDQQLPEQEEPSGVRGWDADP